MIGKRKNAPWFILILFVLSCMVFGEWFSKQPKISPITNPDVQTFSFSKDFTELNTCTIGNIKEITNLRPSGDSGEIVVLSQSIGQGEILAINKNGTFHRWSIENWTIRTEYDFINGSQQGTNFSSDGLFAITPGQVSTNKGLNGYTVWNTDDGDVLTCWGIHCPNGETYTERFWDSGLLLTPDGQFFLRYGGNYVSLYDLDQRKEGGLLIDLDIFDEKFYSIEKLALDSDGLFLACAISEGQVIVVNFDGLFTPTYINEKHIPNNPVKMRHFGKYLGDSNLDTADLSFDNTRRWLAWLNEDGLFVWRVNSIFNRYQIKYPIENGNVLAFSIDGNILAIGTDSEIIIFDTEKNEKLLTVDADPVTAMYFTRDNRFLLYGDQGGVIHVMGISRK